MTRRHPVRLAILAGVAALAASSAGAMEAAQWHPQTGAAWPASAQTDGTRQPPAWTLGHGEATQFRDAVARDTMNSRADVRRELAKARSRGWLAVGEPGATERVWARRAAYVTSSRDADLARNAALQTSPDPIGKLAAMFTATPADQGTALPRDTRNGDRLVAGGPLPLEDSLTVDAR